MGAMDGKALLTAKLLLIGILFSLGGVSPMSWNFEDELDIGKRSMPQFKLCGNHLINMLGLVCGNFGGQGEGNELELLLNGEPPSQVYHQSAPDWQTTAVQRLVHFNSSEVFVEHQTEEVECCLSSSLLLHLC